MLKPLNDVALIKIDSSPYKLNGMELASSQNQEGIENGILQELPEYMPFFGFHAFAFENSLGDVDDEIVEHYEKLVGKRVYWIALAERGGVLQRGEEKYALVKLTDLIGYSEPDETFITDKGKVGL